MKYTPLQHQIYGTNRILETKHVGPFLDMGLGKTVMTLTAIVDLIKEGQVKKILVIAPKKVAENVWTDEIEKWDHLRGKLSTSKILGTEKERKRALQQKADIYLINRENISWLVAIYGNNWPFDMVVIDELSSFKNPKSQRFKSLRLVRPFFKRTVGLTGTPAPNGLLDLWSEVFLLDGGKRLGEKYNEYRDTYFEPAKRDKHTIFSYSLKKGDAILGENFYNKEIFDKIGDICFSMKTEDYLKLPPCIDNDCIIHLSDETLQRYFDFEEEQVMQLADKEISAINAAGLTNKLLQFASGCVYDETKKAHIVHDEKLEELKERLEFLDGEPVLLFYGFICDKERILNEFKFARELKSSQDIKDWNSGKIKLAVVHPASAGHGLNLQFGGSNCIWYTLPWSLEQYLQGKKRIHRNGIVRPVNNMRFITKDTVDEDVMRALSGKDNMQKALIEAVKARIKKYL